MVKCILYLVKPVGWKITIHAEEIVAKDFWTMADEVQPSKNLLLTYPDSGQKNNVRVRGGGARRTTFSAASTTRVRVGGGRLTRSSDVILRIGSRGNGRDRSRGHAARGIQLHESV